MKIVLGINYKAFGVSPIDFFSLIEEYDYLNAIKGIEIGLNLSEYVEEDMDYITEMAKKCREKNYLFHLHSPCLASVENIKAYLDFANELEKEYGKQINIVVHSINQRTVSESVRLTDNYVEQMLKYIKDNNYNLTISIENLNTMEGKKRLTKDDLLELLNRHEDLKFTYDIGHEIVDNIPLAKFPEPVIKKINNIHVHSHQEGKDHYPPGDGDDIESLQQFIQKLNAINYQGTITLEYSFDFLEGVIAHNRLKEYIEKACEFQRIIEINKNKIYFYDEEPY